MQQTISLARFMGYMGVSFCGILVPLLIFKLTGSTTFAGLALAIEWLPKLGLYIFGGGVISYWSSKTTHLYLEIGRVVVVGLLAIAALTSLHYWWLIGLAAMLYQCTNALSNILFENLVTAWWENKAEGHARLLKLDLTAGVIAAGLSLALPSLAVLLFLAFLVQGLTLAIVAHHGSAFYPKNKSDGKGLASVLKSTQKAICIINKSMLGLAGLSMAVTVPFTALIVVLPFVLKEVFPSIDINAQIIALATLARTTIAFGAMHGVRYVLAKNASATPYFAFLSVGCTIAGFPLFLSNSPMAMLLGLALMSLTGFLYSPWARTLRQELISEEPEDLRASLTGLLISIEASTYLLGAGLVLLSHNDMKLLALLATAPLLVISLAWGSYRLAKHSRLAEN